MGWPKSDYGISVGFNAESTARAVDARGRPLSRETSKKRRTELAIKTRSKKVRVEKLDWPEHVYVAIRPIIIDDDDEFVPGHAKESYFFSTKLEDFEDGEDVIEFIGGEEVRKVKRVITATLE